MPLEAVATNLIQHCRSKPGEADNGDQDLRACEISSGQVVSTNAETICRALLNHLPIFIDAFDNNAKSTREIHGDALYHNTVDMYKSSTMTTSRTTRPTRPSSPSSVSLGQNPEETPSCST
mmetsp:Transcript_8020/g.22390  ORF Transcript_8020/g.22390 Transcript_8020/m.22390 type:complete len:121 (+) Transcript_8020:8963-9325(+)